MPWVRVASWVSTSLLSCAVVTGLFVVPAHSQSAVDLRGRLVIDADLSDWRPVECVFRTAQLCSVLALPGPCDPEEPTDDSSWSQLQDVHQLKVTWDAERLYVAATGVIADHALLVLLDVVDGGLEDMTALRAWRRGIRFSDAFRPDFLLAVRDRQRRPELWRLQAVQNLEQVDPDDFESTASFQVDSQGRAVEAAIPWRVLFPEAPLRHNPDPLGPGAPMFVLPPSSAAQGLRLQAVVVHQEEGFGAADVAPDATQALPLAFRDPVTLDRAARVDWHSTTSPGFVAFGAAVQTQTTARFVPEPASPVDEPLSFRLLDTFDVQGAQPRTRLLLADAGHELGFVFDFDDPNLQQVYVSATIYSMRGEPVQVLYENSRRTPVVHTAPWGRFSRPAEDRWNGNGRHGNPADAGMYLLRIDAGLAPGTTAVRQQRTIVVVR